MELGTSWVCLGGEVLIVALVVVRKALLVVDPEEMMDGSVLCLLGMVLASQGRDLEVDLLDLGVHPVPREA